MGEVVEVEMQPMIQFTWDSSGESWPNMKIQNCDSFMMMLVAMDMKERRNSFKFAGGEHNDQPSLTIRFAEYGHLEYEVEALGVFLDQVVVAARYLELYAESYMIEALMNIRAGQNALAATPQKVIALPPGVNPEVARREKTFD